MTAADYEKDLEGDLDGLLDRIKSGRYFAPPVRRRYIPKAYGTKRPPGIPALEDKVAQLAIPMLLELAYEADFLPCSYGFRPGRSAHDALNPFRKGIVEQGQRWVIDADLRSYFASTPHVQEPGRHWMASVTTFFDFLGFTHVWGHPFAGAGNTFFCTFSVTDPTLGLGRHEQHFIASSMS